MSEWVGVPDDDADHDAEALHRHRHLVHAVFRKVPLMDVTQAIAEDDATINEVEVKRITCASRDCYRSFVVQVRDYSERKYCTGKCADNEKRARRADRKAAQE